MGKLKDKIKLGIYKAQSGTSGGMNLKGMLLGSIASELKSLAEKDIKSGKLVITVPYDLKTRSDQLIKGWHANKLLDGGLKMYAVTDDDLRQMMKGVLVELGFMEIVE